MPEALDLEQSESRRMDAEREAEDLRSQLARSNESAQHAQAQSRLEASVQAASMLAPLRAKLAALEREHAETRQMVKEGYGENGLEMNQGVAHSHGDGAGARPADQRTSWLYISFAGDVEQALIPIVATRTL